MKFSIVAFLLSCSLIFGVSCLKSKWNNKQSEAVLSWDVTGYYLYLPAAFIYKDLRKLEFKDKIMEQYKPSSSFYQAFEMSNGDQLLQYPIGLAILYLPFFLLGHIIAGIGGFPQDGFSLPYQMAIWLEGILVAFLGLWVLRKLLLHYFSERAVGITILSLAFATNYLNYAAIDGAMTHNYLFTIYVLLIWVTHRWYNKPNFRDSIYIGILVGFAALTRPSDIVAAIIPLAWGITSFGSVSKVAKLWKEQLPKLILAIVVTGLVGSIQLIYWKIYSGNFLYYTYREYGFSWRGQHLQDCFFSYRKGWLVYTPLMSFALLGFYFLFKHKRELFWWSFLFFFVNTYIIFSWDIWWYGGSFGQRAIVQSYAILAFPLAAFNESVFKTRWKFAIISTYLFCSWLNLHQIYQAHAYKGGMDPEYMTKAYYWRIFGRTNIPDSDKILMDTDEDFLGERSDVNIIFEENFETYNISTNVSQEISHSGKKSIFVEFDFQVSPELTIPAENLNASWVRANGWFYAPQKEWDTWRIAKLRIAFLQNDEVVKERFIRLHRILPIERWTQIWIDCSVPDQPFNKIKVWLDNSGSNVRLYADDFKIETFVE